MDMTQTTEAVDFVLDAVQTTQAALADGKINFSDIPRFLGLVPGAIKGIIGADQIPAELKDMDDAEAAALIQHVMDRLNVTNERAQLIAAAAIKAIAADYALLQLILNKPVPAPAV